MEESVGRGKTVIVTGGNAGLGYECARAIAASDRGWRVVLAVRSIEKGEHAALSISKETGNPNVEVEKLDLSSLDSVRSFARRFASREDLPPLGAVVCNAGLQIVSGTSYTEDGFEKTFGVNHLGHFLLVNLLLKQLAAPARIVFVSSGTHDPERRTGMPAPRYRSPEALAHPEEYPDTVEPGEDPGKTGRIRYTTSKLCNVLCAYELDRRVRRENSGTGAAPITVNAFDPGAVPGTGLTRDYSLPARFVWDRGIALLVPVLRGLGIRFSTAEASGRALARMVTDPALERASGKYFEIGIEARSSEESYDREMAKELWEASARLVRLVPEETLPGLLHAPQTERP